MNLDTRYPGPNFIKFLVLIQEPSSVMSLTFTAIKMRVTLETRYPGPYLIKILALIQEPCSVINGANCLNNRTKDLQDWALFKSYKTTRLNCPKTLHKLIHRRFKKKLIQFFRCYWFSVAPNEGNSTNLREYNLIGVLMGLAVYNSIILVNKQSLHS